MQVDPSDVHTACGFSADCGVHNAPLYERGAFTPVFEEDSIGHEVASSPLEPITPFGQFVDRVVAAAQVPVLRHNPAAILVQPEYSYSRQDQPCDQRCYQPQPLEPAERPMDPALPTELIVTPSATESYKKLAEPLANWVANYVWKACTTGMSLPSVFSQPRYVKTFHHMINFRD